MPPGPAWLEVFPAWLATYVQLCSRPGLPEVVPQLFRSWQVLVLLPVSGQRAGSKLVQLQSGVQEQSVSLATVQPGGQQPSPDTQEIMSVCTHSALHVELRMHLSLVQDSESTHSESSSHSGSLHAPEQQIWPRAPQFVEFVSSRQVSESASAQYCLVLPAQLVSPLLPHSSVQFPEG